MIFKDFEENAEMAPLDLILRRIELRTQLKVNLIDFS